MVDKSTTATSKRPAELTDYLEATAQRNDALILDALAKLEDQTARGKLKPTVASIEKLTGLSRNTIRNRSWALRRLKEIKTKLKSHSEEEKAAGREDDDQGAILDKLRKRVTKILEQNALLYEEVLSLHHAIEQKDKVIEELSTKMKEWNSRKLTRV